MVFVWVWALCFVLPVEVSACPPILGCPPYCPMSSLVPEQTWCFRVSQDHQVSVCSVIPAPKHNLKEQEKSKWTHFPWNINSEPEFPINVWALVCTHVGIVCVFLCYMCVHKIIKWIRKTIYIYILESEQNYPQMEDLGIFFPFVCH